MQNRITSDGTPSADLIPSKSKWPEATGFGVRGAEPRKVSGAAADSSCDTPRGVLMFFVGVCYLYITAQEKT